MIGDYAIAEVNHDIKDDFQAQVNRATSVAGPGSKVEVIHCLPQDPRHARCAAVVSVLRFGLRLTKRLTITVAVGADGSYTWKAPKRWFL